MTTQDWLQSLCLKSEFSSYSKQQRKQTSSNANWLWPVMSKLPAEDKGDTLIPAGRAGWDSGSVTDIFMCPLWKLRAADS